MDKQHIQDAELFAREFFSGDATGHDWYHTDRVRRQAVSIAKQEKGKADICELASLLHDVGDEKMHASQKKGEAFVADWLHQQSMDESEIIQVKEIISTVSFKGGHNAPPQSLEAKIVQDADRLDAIGAIGIARCFMFAGSKGHAMHIPEQSFRESMSSAEYRDNHSSAVHHFYEKLLKIKDLMHTKTGSERALVRHQRLENYLRDFYEEWEA